MLSLTFIEQPRHSQREGGGDRANTFSASLSGPQAGKQEEEDGLGEWDPVHPGHWRRKLKIDDLGRKGERERAMPRK